MNIIAGAARGVELCVPEGVAVRPTSGRAREALFNSLGDLSGLHILDLFAGSGAVGLESAGRNAAGVTLVEISPLHVSCIEENIRRVRAAGVDTPITVINADAAMPSAILPKLRCKPDLIFADPPYDKSSEFFHRLLNDGFFVDRLRGSVLIWEVPDTPGAVGEFLGAKNIDMKLRRFGSTIFLIGEIK